MKKTFIYLFLVLIIIGIVTIIYRINVLRVKSNVTDTSKLESVMVNGKIFKTTGAIPTEDKEGIEAFRQIIRLASIGEVTEQGFRISTTKEGNVIIKIYPEYKINKQKSLNWLINNGFEKINLNDIVFKEVK